MSPKKWGNGSEAYARRTMDLSVLGGVGGRDSAKKGYGPRLDSVNGEQEEGFREDEGKGVNGKSLGVSPRRGGDQTKTANTEMG